MSKNETRKTVVPMVRQPVSNRVETGSTGGTLEERVSVLEEVLQEQVMAVSTTNEDEGATQ